MIAQFDYDEIDPAGEYGNITELIHLLESCWDWDECDFKPLPRSSQQLLTSSDDLHHFAAVITVFLMDIDDYGYTTPSITCQTIAALAPDLYSAFGSDRVLAVCEEVQYSELPAQSARFQELFEDFNREYFGGQLPDYKILVVYDAGYWQTQRCGIPTRSTSLGDILGFIDFEGQRTFVRFHLPLPCGSTMANTLIHEMAHAATDGDHGDAWQAEMARLALLGAPVNEVDLEDNSPAAEKWRGATPKLGCSIGHEPRLEFRITAKTRNSGRERPFVDHARLRWDAAL